MDAPIVEKTQSVVTTKYAGNDPAKLLVRLENIHLDKDRTRKDFKDIQGLADSIWELGLISPILVEPIPDRPGHYLLIAGGCRYRAHILLAAKHGLTHAHCNLFSELSPVLRKKLELEENLRRNAFEPYEEIEGLRQLDILMKQEHGEGGTVGWTKEKTADMVGQDHSFVARKINLATALKNRPDIKERVKHLPITAAIKEVFKIENNEKLERLHGQGQLRITNQLINGDCVEELLKLPSGSIDLVIIDPPFGIPQLTDREGTAGKTGGTYTGLMKPDDNLDDVSALELMEKVIPELGRVMRPSAHVYIFHCNQQRAYLMSLLASSGFTCNHDQVIIWDKGRGTTPFTGYKFVSCYEPIIFAAKLPATRKLNSVEKLIIQCPPTREGDKCHVFQKPHDLLCKLISLSSSLGDTVLDCFAGSGATVKAAMSLGRSAIGIEKNKEHWLNAQMNVGIMGTLPQGVPTPSSGGGK